MPHVTPEIETFARIKVVGLGGSGGNALNHMVNSKVRGVDFVAINTDAQDLHRSLAKKRVNIGKNLTRGLGTGMNPELGRRALEESKEDVQESLKGADMVFISGGTGGGTFSGASPVAARIAKELGALTVAVVTRPFFFEGQQRSKIAEGAINDLKKEVDAIIIIPNDRLLSIVEKNTTMKNAFAICDEILRQAVEGISDLITTPGIINIDFADVRAVLENAGSALMGVGSASGENRATEAARQAINSPLLDVSIAGAKGVLFSIAGGEDLTMFEIQDAAKVITESIDKDAKVIFGTIRDDKLKKNEIRITVIAAGFPESGKPTNTSRPAQKTIEDVLPIPQKEEKRRIFNTLSAREPRESVREPVVPVAPASIAKEKESVRDITPPIAPKEKIEDKKEKDDDDWGVVPAFLRRSKLK
ncbi:MAG: cell division protein FtsZ [Patescibacteria group bacterium]|nr:cell division protein FtsZ [Patescibacteria group bacterium]